MNHRITTWSNDTLASRIASEHDRLGHTLGWRWLASPLSTLDTADAASVSFGMQLWREVFARRTFRTVVTIGRTPADAMAELLGARDYEEAPACFANWTLGRWTFPGGCLVRRPHLSRYALDGGERTNVVASWLNEPCGARTWPSGALAPLKPDDGISPRCSMQRALAASAGRERRLSLQRSGGRPAAIRSRNRSRGRLSAHQAARSRAAKRCTRTAAADGMGMSAPSANIATGIRTSLMRRRDGHGSVTNFPIGLVDLEATWKQ